jgi:hypothetical protein
MVTGNIPSLMTMVRCLTRMFTAATDGATLWLLDIYLSRTPISASLGRMDDSSIASRPDNYFAIPMYHDPTRGWSPIDRAHLFYGRVTGLAPLRAGGDLLGDSSRNEWLLDHKSSHVCSKGDNDSILEAYHQTRMKKFGRHQAVNPGAAARKIPTSLPGQRAWSFRESCACDEVER